MTENGVVIMNKPLIFYEELRNTLVIFEKDAMIVQTRRRARRGSENHEKL